MRSQSSQRDQPGWEATVTNSMSATRSTSLVSRWARFVVWGLAGPVLVVALVDGAAGGPGLFLAPVGMIMVAALTWKKKPVWPEALGIAFGLGSLSLAISYLNRNPRLPCPSGACPGLDPHPWLVVGALLVVVSLASYGWLNMRYVAKA